MNISETMAKERDKKIKDLFFIEKKKRKEIAKILECSRKTVYRYLNNITKKAL